MTLNGCRDEAAKKYFFPPESSDDNLVFTKFSVSLAYLAGTFHNVFCDIFEPNARPDQKETFRLFPAMVLYRHAVELLLKAILNDVCETPPPTTHNVMELFNLICTRQCMCDALGVDVKFVQDALAELQDVDNGQAFRYGTNKQGLPCFPNMPRTVDGKRLFEICERLWRALWQVHGPV